MANSIRWVLALLLGWPVRFPSLGRSWGARRMGFDAAQYSMIDHLQNATKETRRCFRRLAPGVLSWVGLRGIITIVLSLAAARAAQGALAKESVTISRLHNLPASSTNENHAFRLKGVVLCCDAGWHQLYLHDGNETEYFNADDFHILPKKGELVEITGSVRGGDRRENLNLSVLGPTSLPRATPLAITKLGQSRGQWVQVEGRVMSAETSRGRLALLLHNQGQNCFLYVLGTPPSNEFKKILGRQVRVRGINASKVVGGQLDSPLLFVPGLEELTILDPTDRRPALQVTSISSLLNRELGSWTNDWVHINGLIVAYQPGQSLVVKDPTGVIRAQVVQLTEIPGDERVDVWGFLEVSQKETSLKSAYFEVTRTPVDSESNAMLAGTNRRAAEALRIGHRQRTILSQPCRA